MKAQWQEEKQAITQVREMQEGDRSGADGDRAGRAGQYDLNRVAELKYGRLNELEQPAQDRGRADGQQAEAATMLLKEEVTEEDIAEVVSRWTGIPVSRLMEGEREKLLHLDEILHQRVIGQDEAVHGGG